MAMETSRQMEMALPTFIALQSKYNNKYLRYLNEDGNLHGFLEASGYEVVSTYTKYQVETSSTGNGLINIRCCYNNKYFVRSSEHDNWIVAGADEPEEDQKKWSCTLFEPIKQDVHTDSDDDADVDGPTIKLRHVQLGYYVCLRSIDCPPDCGSCLARPCLYAESADPNACELRLFKTIEWERLVILPKYITFKGDNGLYLHTKPIHGNQHLEFKSSNYLDSKVEYEVFMTNNGSIRIKSDAVGKFWRRRSSDDDYWIVVDGENSDVDNIDTLFRPIKLTYNVIALRNMGNKNFCQRRTDDDKNIVSCLSATTSTIMPEAQLQVHETVIKRGLDSLQFRNKDARIYNRKDVVMSTTNLINDSGEAKTMEAKLSYNDLAFSAWRSNVSLKLGLKFDMESRIPYINDDDKVKIPTPVEFDGEYTWGETKDRTTKKTTTHVVTVPPMTTVMVTLRATKGTCDVPFSYAQSDTLTNGEARLYDMDDGIYTGINCYGFYCETKNIDS